MSYQVCLVTGASSGIGKTIYQYLSAYCKGSPFGFNKVIGVSRRGPDIHVDFNRIDFLDYLDDALINLADPDADITVSCIINNAGILDFPEMDVDIHHGLDNLERIMRINFWAPFQLIDWYEADLVENKGSVINIASIAGMVADPGTPIYAASKAALLSLTKSLAIKYAPDVRVNAISPGFFDTPLVAEPTPQEMIDPVPLGFEAQTHMIIPVVRALLESAYVTGSNYVIDGGLSCKVA